MKLSSITEIVGGRLTGQDADISHFSTDSRNIQKDTLFIAIAGEKFDGHDFVDKAIAAGASAVLVQQPIRASVPVIQVQSTVDAYLQLGAACRRQYHPKVIAVTGSCGKTSTRAMLESVFAQAGNTLASQSSYNNHIGVPLTLLQLKPEHDFLISEIGTNQPGEIGPLTKAVHPHVSIITLIAPAHLEGFGTVDAVAVEKGDIYVQLSRQGVAVINADETRYMMQWRSTLQGRRFITFALDNPAAITAKNVTLDAEGYPHFVLCTPDGEVGIQLHCMGRHNVANALAAAAAAFAAGVSLARIKTGLEKALPVMRRLIKKHSYLGATVIDDTYNANPRSAEAALDVLAHYDGESVFVLGDMGELGDDTKAWHEQFGAQAKASGIDRLLCLGPLSEAAAVAFGRAEDNFKTQADLVDALKSIMHQGQTVLVKGSNAMQMHKVVEAIVEEEGS